VQALFPRFFRFIATNLIAGGSPAPAPDAVDQHFDIVVHADSNGVRATRVKAPSDEVAAAHLVDSIVASRERLYRLTQSTQPTAAQRIEERKAMVGMSILGGLAGLII